MEADCITDAPFVHVSRSVEMRAVGLVGADVRLSTVTASLVPSVDTSWTDGLTNATKSPVSIATPKTG